MHWSSRILTGALIRGADRTAAAAAILLVLLRIDGFIYAGLLIGGFVFVASGARRHRMVRKIVAPVAAALVVYHTGRMLYFGDPLPAPLRAKILYKLMPHATLMVKPPERSYGAAFVDAYGWWAAVALAAAIVHGLRSGGFARALSAAAVPLILYVAVVGDWMFGFRFFVALAAGVFGDRGDGHELGGRRGAACRRGALTGMDRRNGSRRGAVH